jgi:hypothetical protein
MNTLLKNENVVNFTEVKTKQKQSVNKKQERIERKKNSVYSITEQARLKYYDLLKLIQNHFVGILFAGLLLFGASIVHTISTVSILQIFFVDYNVMILFLIAMLISIGLEALSVYLYSQHNDFTSHIVSSVSILMILGVSFNEYFTNGISWYSSILRGGLGSIFLIGSLTIAHSIRSKIYANKRVIYEWLPFTKRLQLLKSIRNLDENSKINYRDVCNTFKITQSSLRNLLVKHNKFHSKYFMSFPQRRNRRKNV